MRGRLIMILASALLAGSLVAPGAEARGGGGGGGHGGFGGGGHIGGFGGGHIGGFGGGRIGGLGGGYAGGFNADPMAHVGNDHFGVGRRHVVGSGLSDYGLDCPYNPYYTSDTTLPYNCTY